MEYRKQKTILSMYFPLHKIKIHNCKIDKYTETEIGHVYQDILKVIQEIGLTQDNNIDPGSASI